MVALLSWVGAIPPREQWLELLDEYFRAFGFLAIGPVSFLENIAGLNVFFPGSVTILIAMAYSAGDWMLGLKTFAAIIVPSFLAHHMNFHLGRRLANAPRPDGSERYSTRKGLGVAFATTLWHPHFAAVACMDMGAQRLPYSRFAIAHLPWFLLWNSFWGATMYAIGPQLLREGRFPSVLLVILLVWLLWDLLGVQIRFAAPEARVCAR